MARRMQCHNSDAAHFESLAGAQGAVRHAILVVLAFVMRTQGKLRTGSLLKGCRARRKIRMNVRFEDVDDGDALLGFIFKIAIHAANGIDDYGLAICGNDVGILSQPRNF
jgi:hypothetical protein